MKFEVGLYVGGFFGITLGLLVGAAVARAKRAWRDLIATKNAILGLWQKVFQEYWTATKYVAMATTIVVVGAVYGVWKVAG